MPGKEKAKYRGPTKKREEARELQKRKIQKENMSFYWNHTTIGQRSFHWLVDQVNPAYASQLREETIQQVRFAETLRQAEEEQEEVVRQQHPVFVPKKSMVGNVMEPIILAVGQALPQQRFLAPPLPSMVEGGDGVGSGVALFHQVVSGVASFFSSIDQVLSLPVADAADVRRPASSAAKPVLQEADVAGKSLVKVDALLEKLKKENRITVAIDVDTRGLLSSNSKKDKGLKAQAKKDLEETREWFIGQVRSAAQEGPQTQSIIQKCLTHIGRIELLHPKWSKESIEKDLKGWFGGYAITGNRLIIIADNKSQAGTIIHECWHTIEESTKTRKDEEDDFVKIDACQENLKTLLSDTVDCFNGVRSKHCNEIAKMSKAYRGRPALMECSTIDADKNGFLPQLSLKSVNKKTKEGMVFRKQGRVMCELVPDSTQNLLTGERQPVDKQKEGMMNMMMNLDGLRDRSAIKRLYPKTFREEYRPNTFDKVPERILDEYCPDILKPGGFRAAEEAREKERGVLKTEL